MEKWQKALHTLVLRKAKFTEYLEADSKKDINPKVPMRGWCLSKSLVTNRQHCRWKSCKKQYTIRSVSRENSQGCYKRTTKKILTKKLQCEDYACDHLCWPTDNTVDGNVVKSNKNYGVLIIRIHEVARSKLWERCQREKTCAAKR